jgi:hypothetical protein
MLAAIIPAAVLLAACLYPFAAMIAIIVYWWRFTAAYGASAGLACDSAVRTYYWIVTIHVVVDIQDAICSPQRENNGSRPVTCLGVIKYVLYFVGVCVGLKALVWTASNDEASCSETAPDLFGAGHKYLLVSLVCTAVEVALTCLVCFGAIISMS